MKTRSAGHGADAVIAGAGIAGIAAAWQIAELLGETDTILVDPRPPLSLTSNRREANYRAWWPQPPMVELAERSITLIHDLVASGATIPMNERGYLYVTLDATTADDLPNVLARYEAAGQGREAAELLDAATVRGRYPHVALSMRGAIHARRAGSLDTVALGRAMLERAEARGVRVMRGEVTEIEVERGAAVAVRVQKPDGEERITTERVIDAAGPFASEVGALAGVALPIETVLRQKVLIRDTLGVVPRTAPFTIGLDPTDDLPPGIHIKPDDSVVPDGVKLGWARDQAPSQAFADPVCPPEFQREVVARAGTLIPGLLAYLDGDLPVVAHDGGFYARTPDGLPLIGATSIAGFFVVGGLAGFGAMMAPAAGERVARIAIGRSSGAMNPFLPERPVGSAGIPPSDGRRRPGEL